MDSESPGSDLEFSVIGEAEQSCCPLREHITDSHISLPPPTPR